MSLTLKELAQRALDVQNACNLLGVLRSAHLDLCELRTLLDLSTTALASHPIARAWADKIASLAGNFGSVATGTDFQELESMARGGPGKEFIEIAETL